LEELPVKILTTGQNERRRFPSGRRMTPHRIVEDLEEFAADWKYEAVSIGYPGSCSPRSGGYRTHNMAKAWIVFDFNAAFGCPVEIMNDAAMQALGSYMVGTMLFPALGTGLGSALVVGKHK